MVPNGVNMSDVKSKNKSGILRLLNRNGSMSRKDIAAALKLTPAAVTIICSDLIDQGLIAECGIDDSEQGRAGRKKILLTLCIDRFYAVSVNMETDFTYVSLVCLNGALLCTARIQTVRDAKTQLQAAADTINRMLAAHQDIREQVLGVGIGIVGAYSETRQETVGTFGLWKQGVRVADILQSLTGLPVCCENNVKCFAQAELIYGKKTQNVFFVKWGSGVGSALVSDGALSHAAQEIGHYIVDPYGEQCRCGRHGCLETYASSYALKESVGKLFSPAQTPLLYRSLNGDITALVEELRRHGADGLDDKVREIFAERIHFLAMAAVNTATVIAPEKIIVYGNIWNDGFFRDFCDACERYSDSFGDGFIELSSLQDKRDYIGPAALVADRFFFG
ncbi:MAG: ROK family transcriptional regulator [Clostridia bacterium]|nr:ROK family transcriptional regulator [Clostridia bacterium]